jgi:hypothetical protein
VIDRVETSDIEGVSVAAVVKPRYIRIGRFGEIVLELFDLTDTGLVLDALPRVSFRCIVYRSEMSREEINQCMTICGSGRG